MPPARSLSSARDFQERPIRITSPLTAAVFLAAGFVPAAAFAQQLSVYAPAAAAVAKPLGSAQRLERRFLQITAANLRFQSDASRLVLVRSNNPAVKELAQTLLARQQTAQPELLHLLQARGMAMPIPGSDHTRILKELGKLTGARFDRLYVEEVLLRSYQADIGNCEQVLSQADDPVLKGWIERQLPTLRFQVAKASKALPSSTLRGQRAV